MNKDSFLSQIYANNKIPLYQLLDEILNVSTEQDEENMYLLWLNNFNFGANVKLNPHIIEAQDNSFYYKFTTIQKSHELYDALYNAIKNNGVSIQKVLELYSDSKISSQSTLYKRVLQVYNSLEEQEKVQFENEVITYCNIVSGRFQPFVSYSIDSKDESNIRGLQRELSNIQLMFTRRVNNFKMKGMYPELSDSEHFLFDIRKMLEKEIPQDAGLKYGDYLNKAKILALLTSKWESKTEDVEYVKYSMEQLDLVIKFIEIAFPIYKNLDNPQDINFNQMIELMYCACKSRILQEISQTDMDRLLTVTYEIIDRLEVDYMKAYDSDIHQDLANTDLKNPSEYSKYLMRVLNLGYGEALFEHLASKYYDNNPDIYKLHLISKKNNEHIDLDLYNELVFAKNLRYLLETNNITILKWLDRSYLKWDKNVINELKNNLTSLYQDEAKINSTNFSLMQSDFVITDESMLRFPRLYSIEDTLINKKDNTLRIGVLLKNQTNTMIRSDKGNANYYLLHIDINDITKDKSKFEIQLNLLVGSEISNRIQMLRMDNYINKGVHKNTGALRIDTTTHLHKYNALNKVRKNKNGEMDIYKNWENGVENFTEGLEIFLKEMGMNVELQKILKKQILNNIDIHKNKRV